MPLEATVVCIDSSDWMRNGDYTPTRMEAQHDAVNLICNAKTQSNPESSVGVVACGGKNPSVMVTLTTDIGKILTSLHQVKVGGSLSLSSGVQVAQLVLKHRQNKNQQQRIVFFVGSPVTEAEENLVQLGKKLRKNKVAVDVVNFGEESENTQKLEAFVGSVNSGDNSHLVTIPPGPHVLSDILISSPIISEGGSSANPSDFESYGGIDPSMDPELAMVLKMSMEEERARQDAANKKAMEESTSTSTPATSSSTSSVIPTTSTSDHVMKDADENEDDLLNQAIAMSMAGVSSTPANSSSTPAPSSSTSASNVNTSGGDVDMSELTEEQEMQLALQMSMNAASGNDQDVNQVMNDPSFVNSVLASLPGVDPNDEQIKNLLQNLTQNQGEKKEEGKK